MRKKFLTRAFLLAAIIFCGGFCCHMQAFAADTVETYVVIGTLTYDLFKDESGGTPVLYRNS